MKEIVAAGLFVVALVAQAGATTYYVDVDHPNADDSNPGSPELPWETIHKANRTVEPGDTVIVRPGVYHDWICPDTTGYAGAWITYRADPRRQAHLDGWCDLEEAAEDTSEWRHIVPDTANIWYRKLKSGFFVEAWMDSVRMGCPYEYSCGETLHFEPGRSYVDSTATLYVWLEEGDDPFGHQWNVTLCSGVWLYPYLGKPREYIRIEGFVVERYGTAGIVSYQDPVVIRDNLARYNGRAGITVNSCGLETVLVEDNEAHHNCGGIGFCQGMGAFKPTGPNIVFRRNISHDNYDGGPCGTDGFGFFLDTGYDVGGATFVNNVAYGNAGLGFGAYQSDNAVFVNNTSFGNGRGEIGIYGSYEAGSDHLIVRNNILVAQGLNEPLQLQFSYSALPAQMDLDHNLYFRPGADEETDLFNVTLRYGGGDQYTVLCDLDEFAALGDSLSEEYGVSYAWGDGSLVANPHMLYPYEDAYDFRICSDSPALDAGTCGGAPAEDFFRNARPAGDGCDIGAHEFQPTDGLEELPGATVLSMSPSPNPFAGSLSISYSLDAPTTVELAVYDVRGRLVVRLDGGERRAGTHEVRWNGRNAAGQKVASGVYFVRLAAGDRQCVGKALLVR